jgi:hypothetical protein
VPKKVATIDKFKTGAHSIQDPRDLPEGAVVDAVNVMTDVEGKVRQMGRDISHPLTSQFDSVAFNTPGYGFFSFKSDNRIKGNINEIEGNVNVESSILAYQSANAIGFFDIQNNDDLVSLGNVEINVKPAFYYSTVDGAIRMCDSNYSNINIDEGSIIPADSNFLTKYFKFMNKTWFASNVASSDADTPVPHEGWINNSTEGLDSFIYPPTVEASANLMASADTTSTAYNLVYHHASTIDDAFDNDERDLMQPGNIGLYIDESNAEAGDSDWLADDYNFGISFVYEGGQESQVTSWDSAFHLTLANTGRFIELQVFVCTGKSANAFDPRIIGCNVYLTGDSGGMYDDPYYLAEFHWGTSEVHGPRLTNSDGNFTEAFTWDSDAGVVYNTAVLNIHKTPVITYSMRNGFRTDSESICLNYTTSIIANRRCYAGNVRRYSLDANTVASEDINNGQNTDWKQPDIKEHSTFVNNDLMVVSPVDKYDIFPDDNTLDLGSNDGDHIVLLLEYADRLLQFKQNKTYLINISEDLEFIEAEYDFMGIKYPYQAIKTELGIAWVNENGCYLYNGEEVLNLIEGKIGQNDESDFESLEKFPSWSAFVGNTAMIGYIPKNKQIVIFQDAAGVSVYGNVLVYDMDNEAWTRGYDRVIGAPKSNIVTKYDNSLLYSAPVNTTIEDFKVSEYKNSQPSQDETWTLINLNSKEISSDTDGSQLVIGTTAIMNVSHYSSADNNELTYAEHIKEEILSYVPSNTFNVDISGNDLIIAMKGKNLSNTYSGKALSWSTGSSMGAPVTNTAFSLQSLISDPSQKYFMYTDGSDVQMGPFASSGMMMNEPYDFGIPSPFDHIVELGYSSGQKQFNPSMLSKIGQMTTNQSASGFSSVAHDEPRIKLNRTDGSNYTFADTTTATEVVLDLYSKSLFNNKNDYQTLGSNDDRLSGNYLSRHDDFSGDFTFTESSLTGGTNQQPQQYSNILQSYLIYTASPEEDGSSEDTITNNGSTLKQWVDASVGSDYYDAPATITIPTMIFTDTIFLTETNKKIIIPGKHADKFIMGESYTFANTGKSSNNNTYIFSSVQEFVYEDVNGVFVDDDYRSITVLSYRYVDNSSFFNSVINWTTFETVTITGGSAFTSIGNNSIGSKSVKQELLLIPTRKDQRNNVTYNLSLDGQDNRSYYLNLPVIDEQEYYVQNPFDANLKRAYRDRELNTTPWWDTHTFMLPGARRLFCENGQGVTTTGDLNNSNTTPFSVTLLAGINLELIAEAVNVGDLLMARQGTNYEIMDVQSISGTTITVTRAFEAQSSTGSAVNFGAVTIDWYKINTIKQVSATQIQIKGGDYTKVFIPDLQFHIYDLGNDSDGDDAWSYVEHSGDGLNHHICESSSFTPATGTTVNIKTGLTYADAAFNGTDGAYYFKFPNNNADDWMDNVAGDEPGNESISGVAFTSGTEAEYEPDAGSGTGNALGKAIGSNNVMLTCRAQHIIANNPDDYDDINAATWVASGLEFRQFNNFVMDSNSSNAISSDFPTYVLTQDLVLDDDMHTKKVLYEVSLSYKYSGIISIEAIVNGNQYYHLFENNLSVESGSSGKMKRGSKRLMPGNQVTQSTTAGNHYSGWKNKTFSFAFPNGEGLDYIKNAKTIQFKVIGLPGGYGFEINDISVVYRSLDAGR